MKKFLLFCSVCAIALHGLAADKYYLITSESSNSNGGFYNPSYWSSNGENTGTITQEFDPDAEYVVYKKSGSKIYIKAAPDGKTYDFGGGSLVLGQGTSFGALYNYVYDTSENDKKALTFGKDGLIIRCGGVLLSGANNKFYIVNGPITVDTEEEAYAFLNFYYSNVTFSHRGTLTITEGSVFTVGDNEMANDLRPTKGNLILTDVASCSGVLGTLEIISALYKCDNVILDEYDTTLSVASTDLPGTLSVGTNCRLKLISGEDELSVGTLAFADNTWFDVSYDTEKQAFGKVNVTKELAIDGVVNVNVAKPLYLSKTGKMAILTAPANSGLSIENFRLTDSSCDPFRSLTVEEDEEGRRVLYLNYLESPVFQLHSVATNAVMEHWSDGSATAVAGKHYCLDLSMITNKAAAVYLKMPSKAHAEEGLAQNKEGHHEFLGESLTLGRSCSLVWAWQTTVPREFKCKLLRLLDGSYIDGEQKAALKIYGGTLEAVSGTVKFGASNGRDMIVESDIKGSAEIILTGNLSANSSPYARYSFTGDNSDFKGLITVKQRLIDTTGKNNYNTAYNSLEVSKRASLGGAMTKLTPKALTLTSYGQLRVAGDIILEAASNRGIFIENDGRISVQSSKKALYTFRIETPLAINGTFYKEGLGTLELAGSMAFGEDGLAETPTEGSNGFVVTGGVVRVCSAGAIDGCSMELRKGASLELAVDFEDEELMAQGIRNVKTDMPFVLGEGVEKLPLSLKFAGDATPPSTEFTVPLLTVSSGAADSVRAMLPAVKFPFKSYQATLVETVEKDAEDKPKYVTFAYELKYQALKVIVR